MSLKIKRIQSLTLFYLQLGIRDSQLGALYALKWTWDRNFQYEEYPSFMDRYNAVLESIKVSIIRTVYQFCQKFPLLTFAKQVSKKAVADLMEPSWVCRLANAPDYEVQRKNRNKEGNKKKQTLLEEANAKRKRDREEQEDHQEAGEDNHDAASHSHSETSAAPATPARQATRKTASRNARKQPKRLASDTPRQAAANTQSVTAPPSGQPAMPAMPQGFTQEATVAPQTAVNDFHPVNQADQFFGPLNTRNPSVGATAYPSAQPQTTSVSFQGQPQAFALHQSGYPQQFFSQNTADQHFAFNAPSLGDSLSPAYGNNSQFLPQENNFSAQFMPQTISSPGIGPSLNNTSGHISSAPNTPFSSAPQTPWSAETPEFTSPHALGSAPDNQQFANAWDAQMSFWGDENPQFDFS